MLLLLHSFHMDAGKLCQQAITDLWGSQVFLDISWVFPIECIYELDMLLRDASIYKLPRVLSSLVAQMVKNLLAVQETQAPSLGQEDPLEKGMATYSSILA